MSSAKPRTRICCKCGNKLWGNHFLEKVIDGHSRVLHKTCAKTKEEDEESEMDDIDCTCWDEMGADPYCVHHGWKD